MNTLFVVIQILILRHDFKPFQLLQLVATVVFGAMIDIASSVLSGITPSSYPEQLLLCFIGIILVALGISIEVMAGLVTVPGEGMVLTISKVAGMKFGNMKVCFDVTLVITATCLSFIFLKHLDGIREGTFLAALLVGQVTKITNKLTGTLGKRIFR